jgi:hypothetical protein
MRSEEAEDGYMKAFLYLGQSDLNSLPPGLNANEANRASHLISTWISSRFHENL